MSAALRLALRRAREWIPVVVFAFGLTIARSSFADHYHVPTGSMEPTVEVGDRVLVNKAAYAIRLPFTTSPLIHTGVIGRGDVVVLDSPDSAEVLLKRVVAVGGDLVTVHEGHTSVNGRFDKMLGTSHEELDGHVHALNLSDGPGPDLESVRVPLGQVLVLGDHRGNSRDGRFFGFVREESILGHVRAVYMRHGHFTWQPL